MEKHGVFSWLKTNFLLTDLTSLVTRSKPVCTMGRCFSKQHGSSIRNKRVDCFDFFKPVAYIEGGVLAKQGGLEGIIRLLNN